MAAEDVLGLQMDEQLELRKGEGLGRVHHRHAR